MSICSAGPREAPRAIPLRAPPSCSAFFCLAETGWIIRASEPKGALDLANHGYDNMDPSMTALFIASGPAFARGVTLPMFDMSTSTRFWHGFRDRAAAEPRAIPPPSPRSEALSRTPLHRVGAAFMDAI
jgi:hypothetical protein